MESLILLFSSVNKLSFIVFVVGLFFFCFEAYTLFKEKEKKTKPQIPQFNVKNFDKKTIITSVSPTVIKNKKSVISRFNVHLVLVIILFIMTVSFFFLSIISIKANKEGGSQKTQITYSEIQSKGVKIYTQNFVKELNEQDLVQLPAGTSIVVGIETIQGTDIDRARIKINEKEWGIRHITTLFDAVKKVYYTYYSIATGESSLSIDAQLHSFSDGWLGD